MGLQSKLGSTGKYSSHVELTRRKLKDRISKKRSKTLENTKTNQPYLPCTNKKLVGNVNVSVASQSKRRDENCTRRYLRGLRNQNGKHLVNLCQPDILET